jgi:hypothetical protein
MSILSDKYVIDESAFPFHIYYDIDFCNTQKDNVEAPIVSFSENRTQPFIKRPDLYHASIIRFHVETSNSLPVFIPEVLIGQNDINKLTYTITMKYKNVEYRQYVMYSPQSPNELLPQPPTKFGDYTNSYYYIYNYSYWIKLVNKALLDCFNSLKSAVIAGGDNLPNAGNIQPPFMEFDTTANLGIINCDVLGFDSGLTNPIEIYFNTNFFNLFSTFECLKYGANIQNGKNYKLIIDNNETTNILNLPSGNYISLQQDYSTVSQWCPINSIVFTSSLPIVNTNVASPKLYGIETNMYSNGNNANMVDIITDFIADDYRTEILYVPQGEYRLFDMLGTNPIYNLRLEVYWKDKYANLHPFRLENGCSASIKFLFRRKDFSSYKLIKDM